MSFAMKDGDAIAKTRPSAPSPEAIGTSIGSEFSGPENMRLWHEVERTDPAHVKQITGKQYRGNSPRPQWLVQQATRVFGPCGIGWGYTIEDRIERDEAAALHIAKVKLWYVLDGKRGELEHIGATPFSGKRKSGESYLDEDAPKKSVTDALVKALSMLGFAGDIFLGRWDDQKYVAGLHDEFSPPPPVARALAPPPPVQPVSEQVWMNFKLALSAADSEEMLDARYAQFMTKYRPGRSDNDEAVRLLAQARERLLAPAGEQ